MNVRLPEPLWLQLKYIASHTPGSMHAFVLEAVEKAARKKIDKLEDSGKI